MSTIPINKTNALKAFKAADTNGKILLENLFGKEIFSEKITDKVKSFEDACCIQGIDHSKALPYALPMSDYEEGLNAFAMLTIIAQALNEGWKPDWDNSSQYKYYPWFNMKSGSGLSYNVCAYWSTHTYIGSRLCFKSSELADYAGKQFLSIYRKFLTLQ